MNGIFFTRNYIPALKKFPAKYIFEPWKAPTTMQQTAGCIIGKDYPKPIVDHDIVRQQNIQKMAAAYAKSKSSNPGNLYFKFFSNVDQLHV